MTRTRFGRATTLAAALLTLVPAALAQDYGRLEDTQASAPGYFFFARPGEPTVSVTAVGAVGATGLYLLGVGSTVADLVALAGGAPLPADPATASDAVVRLLRDGAVLVETPYPELYSAGAAPMRLADGDVVEVSAPTSTALVSTAGGYFVHARPGQATITATAVGAVRSPGRYVLETGADVADLLALSGGAALGERDADVRVTATVQVYRGSEVTFSTPLEALYTQQTPSLTDGDVVELSVVTKRRSPFTWRDALSIVTTAAAIALTADRIAN